MTGFNPTQKMGVGVSLPLPGPQTNTAVGTASVTSGGKGFFHDLLDVINPLQHLPVISTVYRAITGEHIGTLEKIAGDTLYGGMWGAISSVADSMFEAATGKDFGSTVLALFSGPQDQNKQVAANVPAPKSVIPAGDAMTQGTPQGLDVAALSASLSGKGVDGDTARRALFAYQRSLVLPNVPLMPMAASLN
jgi:hypothetical protein